jgi:hypothetical protein
MKGSIGKLSHRLDGLTVFAGDEPESYDELVQRAQERIRELKDTCQDNYLSFEYNDEWVRGRFVDAVEGNFPGTFMIVLRIPSSRICSGPCFVNLPDEVISGIVVTGKNGLVGITTKAFPRKKSATWHYDQADFARCA